MKSGKSSSFEQFIIAVFQCWSLLKLFMVNIFKQYTVAKQTTVIRSNNFHNSILVIGDDFAYGTGDAPKIGRPKGITNYLQQKFSNTSKIKQNWVISNEGKPQSTSSDWLPQSERSESTSTNLAYFEKLNDKIVSASIVILSVGFNDVCTENALTNIFKICKVLCQMEKRVLFLDSFSADDEVAQILKEYEGVSVMNISKSNYEYKGEFLYYSGPSVSDAEQYKFFNDRGYNTVSRNLADLMEDTMVKIEFQKFRKYLK